jgi:hypothetical protein
MRVVITALALSAVSFAAGVAGDLSIAAPSPPSAVVAIPPAPPNAVRAHPLPPLHHAQALTRQAKPRSARSPEFVDVPEIQLEPAALTTRVSPHLAQKVGDLIRA